jgi:hypothetical protein
VTDDIAALAAAVSGVGVTLALAVLSRDEAALLLMLLLVAYDLRAPIVEGGSGVGVMEGDADTVMEAVGVAD